jgi:hypothetical protein
MLLRLNTQHNYGNAPEMATTAQYPSSPDDGFGSDVFLQTSGFP